VRSRDPRISLRSERLTPPLFVGDYFDVVRAVALGRRGTPVGGTSFRSLAGGRLLVYFPDLDLACGAAEAESRGYFDVHNAPAWDTWVAAIQDDEGGHECPYLVSWVPAEIVPLAEGGIRVNPEQCILWLEDAPVRLRDLMREDRPPPPG
jgi:hypothetical protein